MPHQDEFDEASGIADLAPGAEDDTPPDRRGPNSLTLMTPIRLSCAGHPDPPKAAEFHAAFHTREPSPRTDFLVLVWMSESTANEMIDAWRDHCYTRRELAGAGGSLPPRRNRRRRERAGHEGGGLPYGNRGAVAMTGGTLPEAAQTLWNAHGELLIERLDGIDGETTRWALGGGPSWRNDGNTAGASIWTSPDRKALRRQP